MSYLRCTARRFSNNQHDLCIREGIQVGGSSAEPETDIDCDVVNCSYNKDYKCAAASVDISGSSACTCRETQCSTFDSKKTL